MTRSLIPIVIAAFTLYTLVACARTEESYIRSLPKWGWILAIILLVPIGSVAYWIAGRPKRPRSIHGPKRRILPPDDDPDFLRNIKL